MKQETITVNGTHYPVIFTLATISNFEDITGKPFFSSNLDTVNNRIAIIRAAAVAADDSTALTVDDLRGKEDLDAYRQIAEAYAVVMRLAAEFFHIPEVENGKDAPQPTEGEPAKN
jgi:hypothetical protein